MASLNKVMLIGNVTRDPEIKYTPKGSAVADLGLAINRNYTNQAGEKVEEVTYVDVELWGRLAEIAGEYAKKGRPIFIEGRLRRGSLGVHGGIGSHRNRCFSHSPYCLQTSSALRTSTM